MIDFIFEMFALFIGQILDETVPVRSFLVFVGAMLLLAALTLVLMGAWVIYIMITGTDQTLAEIIIRAGLVLYFWLLAVICWWVAKKAWQARA